MVNEADPNLSDFTTMPRLVYGTHLHAKYCPVRNTTTEGVADDALFMQWILLAAEVYIAQARGIVGTSIFQRKARIYQELGEMISDPVTRNSNTTISVLAAASIAEARFGDFELGRKHCKALFHLLNSQGGPPALRKKTFTTIATRVIVSFVSIGAGHALFADYIKLLGSLRCLKESLLAIQTWSRSYFFNDAVLQGSTKNDKLIAEASVSAPNLSQKIERYHSARAAAFAPGSVLHRFAVPVFEEHSTIEQRCLVAILTTIVVVLFDLRNEYDESVRFLHDMVSTIASGQAANVDDLPPPKVLTVLYITTDCAERYESIGFDLRWNTLRSWLAVEVLELVQLASHWGRMRILASLSNSLTGGIGDDARSFMTEEEVTAICDEMRVSWMRKSGLEEF
jgi:hypothetical protein